MIWATLRKWNTILSDWHPKKNLKRPMCAADPLITAPPYLSRAKCGEGIRFEPF